MKQRKKRTRILILCASLLIALLLVSANLALMRPPSSPHRAELIMAEEQQTVDSFSVTEETEETRKTEYAETERQLLVPDSRWRGLLTISEHAGYGSLSDGSFPVTGILGKVESRCFLELRREDDDSLILSFWCELDDDTIHPIIGDHDARFFDIWLSGKDSQALTLTLRERQIDLRFFYDDGMESCQIDFSIKPENNT